MHSICFDGDDRSNAILAPLMDCHYLGRIVSGEPNIHSGSFDKAELFPSMMSHSIRFTVKQKVDKNNLLLTCLQGLQIRGGKGYFSIEFLEFSIENLIEG